MRCLAILFPTSVKYRREPKVLTQNSIGCIEFGGGGGVINIKPLIWLLILCSCNIFSYIEIISVYVEPMLGAWDVIFGKRIEAVSDGRLKLALFYLLLFYLSSRKQRNWLRAGEEC